MVQNDEIGAAFAILKKAIYERRAEFLDQWMGASDVQLQLIALEIKLCGCSTSLPYDEET